MLQEILVVLIFLGSLTYLSSILYKTFVVKNTGCATGCGKCGAVDFQKIEKQLKEKRG
jgi:hypothetical protein